MDLSQLPALARLFEKPALVRHIFTSFASVSVMSSYNATVELFSKMCFSQLSQALSALDAANDGLGATLVPRPRSQALGKLNSNV